MNKLIFSVLALLLLRPLSVGAPPMQSLDQPCTITEDSIFDGIETDGKERAGSLAKADLTVASFGIGRSTLKDIIKRFPDAKQFRLTKEEEAAKGICLKNDGKHAVVFASGSAGGWDVIDSIYLGDSIVFEKKGAKCSTVNALDKLSTASGVKIGMTTKDVLILLHRPAVCGSNFYINYSTSPDKAPWASSKVRPSTKEGWVAMSGAMGAFKAGHLSWLALYGTVSN